MLIFRRGTWHRCWPKFSVFPTVYISFCFTLLLCCLFSFSFFFLLAILFHLKLLALARSLFNCSFSIFEVLYFFTAPPSAPPCSILFHFPCDFPVGFFFCFSLGLVWFCGLFVCFMRQPRKAISRRKGGVRASGKTRNVNKGPARVERSIHASVCLAQCPPNPPNPRPNIPSNPVRFPMPSSLIESPIISFQSVQPTCCPAVLLYRSFPFPPDVLSSRLCLHGHVAVGLLQNGRCPDAAAAARLPLLHDPVHDVQLQVVYAAAMVGQRRSADGAAPATATASDKKF